MDCLLVRVNNHLSRTSGQVLFRTLDERTTWFFSKLIKNMNFLKVCSTEQVTPFSGQSIEYIMLNPCRASIKHVVMHSV